MKCAVCDATLVTHLFLRQLVAEIPLGQNILNFSANKRIPEDFIFQLTDAEKAGVVTNCDHLVKLKCSPHQKETPHRLCAMERKMIPTLLSYADIVQSPYIVRQAQRRLAHVSS
jgi:hypothetical protein